MSGISPWLSIVGIGEDGLENVPSIGRALIDGADVLIGGARHLEMIPESHPAERLTWRSPLKDTVADIEARRGKNVCVLATGDPMSYGIGVTLGRIFGGDALTVVPAAGAFSLAAARLGWPLQDVRCLTLHGRPLDLLNAHLMPGLRLLVLSEDGKTPAKVAGRLREKGYGASRLVVLEHMGGPKERRTDGTAREWDAAEVANLNTIAIELVPDAGTPLYGVAPGLPDDAFSHDGKITKREVRAATLALLTPVPGQLLWDVGAGSGSVAIEWMRAGGRAIAIERDQERIASIAHNAASLGTPTLKILEGSAPDIFQGLEAPDAVFIGGGLSEISVFEQAFAALKPGGRIVANAVTLEGETALNMIYARFGGEMSRIAVSRLSPVGPYNGWRPLMPVTQYFRIKD